MKLKVSNAFLNVMLAAMTAGILFMEHFNRSPKFLIGTCAALIMCGIIFTWRRKNLTSWIICPIIFFMLGGLRFSAVDTLPPNDISKFAGQAVQISGVVREETQIKILPNGLTQVRFVIDAETIKLRDAEEKICGGLILTYYPKEGEPLPAARIGDRIFTGGNLKLLHNYNNPGQIDTVTRMKADGITARMSASKQGIEIEQVEGSLWIKFLRMVAAIREHYREAMAEVMSAEDAAAVFAMLFGGYAGLNPELVEDFQTTGIVHILSVSGSHMSMLAMATAWLCLLLKFPRGVTFAIGLFVIGTYAILSGLLPQVLRSASMGVLIFFAKTLSRETEGARLLTLTATLMLINQPLLLFDVSFQLSFTATAGLMYLSEDLSNAMERLPKFFFRAYVNDNRRAVGKPADNYLVLQSNIVELGFGKCFRHAALGNCNRRRTFGRNNHGGRACYRKNIFHGRGVNLRSRRGVESRLCKFTVQRSSSADSRIIGGIFLLCRVDSPTPDNFVADNFFAYVKCLQIRRRA